MASRKWIVVLLFTAGQCMFGGYVGAADDFNACTSLTPLPDGSDLPSPLILSEIRPGEYIEFFNNTVQPIDLGSENYWLFARPISADLRLLAAGVTVPPSGFATIPFPSSFLDSPLGGEIVLYRDIEVAQEFYNGTFIVDFVCWGISPHLSVKAVAESVGRWDGPCASSLGNGSLHRLPSTPGASSSSYDPNAFASPQNCSPGQPDDASPAQEELVPHGRRLLHYQTVGHSNPSLPGQVSASVCSVEEGWNANVMATLVPLVDRLGPDGFDWWGHDLGGAWPSHGVLLTATLWTDTPFEQIAIAREEFPPLVDYAPLSEFCSQNDIGLYGYMGFPRCDADDGDGIPPTFVFEPMPEHCDPDYLMEWYGEPIDHGFKGMAHDWASALPPYSAVLSELFPALESFGVEPIIEPVPWRAFPHLLGLSVVAEEWSWQNSAQDLEHRFSEAEIVAAGGRAIHMVIRSAPGEPADQQWRFETAAQLLAEGRTVAVDLYQLMQAGYPIELLVALSKLQFDEGEPLKSLSQ